jgi:microcystin-dependent protein
MSDLQCTGTNFTQNILRTECIGDSLQKINDNFRSLDSEVCNLYNTKLNISGGTMIGHLTLSLQPSADGHATTKLYVDNWVAALTTMIQRTPPAGTIAAYAGNVDPTGWMICNGRSLNRGDYPALFAAIDTIYGAEDGILKFRIPDLRGCFLRGFDSSRGLDPGRAFGSYQADGFKTHSHASGTADTGGTHGHSGTANEGGGHSHTYYRAMNVTWECDFTKGQGSGCGARELVTQEHQTHGGNGSHSHTVSISPGGAHGHTLTIPSGFDGGITETRPKNVAMNYIIKVV